jgi:hypothetical protein
MQYVRTELLKVVHCPLVHQIQTYCTGQKEYLYLAWKDAVAGTTTAVSDRYRYYQQGQT